MSDMDQSTDIDDVDVDVPRTVAQRRRAALFEDALLFCCAFTAGAVVYGLVRGVVSLLGDRSDDFWTIGLSDDLVFAGLVAGEAFVLWNNGWRQGRRGHSLGKHREGVAVVDVTSGQPTGALRGLVRGLAVVVLLDLSAAAVPIDLPTVLRRSTPDSWHLGFATYLALALLVVPLLFSLDRMVTDRVAGTQVVEGARTSAGRSRIVLLLELVGVVGVLGLAVAYIAFFSPLIRFPDVF